MLILSILFPVLLGLGVLMKREIKNRKALLTLTGAGLIVTAALGLGVVFAGEAELMLFSFGKNLDIYFHVSGIGKNNITLNAELELNTVRVNCEGFCRMVGCAYRYFRQNEVKGAQIAVVSSIAGTKGLGAAPAYSATKRMQNCYIQSLAQQCAIAKVDIAFTDIRPGFVATPLLDTDHHHYPMLMTTPYAARRIVRAIVARRRVAVIDWRYAILVAVWRCIPRWLWERLPIKAAQK